MWADAARLIKDYPVLGSGLNTYTQVIHDYTGSDKRRGQYPHNSYLQMMAETGAVGLFSFLAILFVFFKESFSLLSRKKEEAWLWGLITALIGILVHSFFDTNLYALKLVVYFWIILGLGVSRIKMLK